MGPGATSSHHQEYRVLLPGLSSLRLSITRKPGGREGPPPPHRLAHQNSVQRQASLPLHQAAILPFLSPDSSSSPSDHRRLVAKGPQGQRPRWPSRARGRLLPTQQSLKPVLAHFFRTQSQAGIRHLLSPNEPPPTGYSRGGGGAEPARLQGRKAGEGERL